LKPLKEARHSRASLFLLPVTRDPAAPIAGAVAKLLAQALFRRTRVTICEPLAGCALDRARHALGVVNAKGHPLVVAGIELGEGTASHSRENVVKLVIKLADGQRDPELIRKAAVAILTGQ
jgi:hypothetical protein